MLKHPLRSTGRSHCPDQPIDHRSQVDRRIVARRSRWCPSRNACCPSVSGFGQPGGVLCELLGFLLGSRRQSAEGVGDVAACCIRGRPRPVGSRPGRGLCDARRRTPVADLRRFGGASAPRGVAVVATGLAIDAILGVMYGYLGRKANAIREAEDATRAVPIAQDGYSGPTTRSCSRGRTRSWASRTKRSTHSARCCVFRSVERCDAEDRPGFRPAAVQPPVPSVGERRSVSATYSL